MTLHKSASARGRYPWLWLVLMILLTAVFTIVALSQPGKSIVFDNESVHDYNDGWELLDQSGQPIMPITLPAKVKTDGTVRIAKTIYEELVNPAVLNMRTSHQKVRLYCDDELIYSFGYDDMPIFGKSPGSAWNLVRLPQDNEGKRLLLELYSPYPTKNGVIDSIKIGSKSALVFSLLRRYTFSLLLTLIIFSTGIVSLLSYFLIMRKDTPVNKETLYLGWFAVFVSIWMFGEGRLAQFFFIPPAINTYVTFAAMLVTLIPLVNYVACGQHGFSRKLLEMASKGLALQFVVSLMLQAFNILDFMEQLPFIHFVIIICCILILYIVTCSAVRRRSSEQYRLLISLGILAVFFVLETVFLYIGNHSTGGMMRIGVLVVITIQVQAAFKKATDIMRMSRLAGVDALTGCHNRTIYEQLVIELEGQNRVGVVIADINDLKTINDNYGHDIGDDAITRCSQCFSEAFSPYGRCFRIGGDEFAMLGKNLSTEQLGRIGKSFAEINKDVAAQTDYPFAVAYGYAVYDPHRDKTLSDAVRRADKAMYDNKRQFKGQEEYFYPQCEQTRV